MTTTKEFSEGLKNLEAALASRLDLPRCSSTTQLLGDSMDMQVKYLPVDGTISLNGYFKPKSDLLIYDPRLGTIGLVYDISTFVGRKIEAALQTGLENAIYIRHLLVQEPKRKLVDQNGQLPLAVEVVFLGALVEEGQIQSALRLLAQKNALLNAIHGVGINVLCCNPEVSGYFTDSDLRRAFSWLLLACSKWYATQVKPRPDSGSFSGLELENYRQSGKRQLFLAKKARVHIVFGANGTGKSSISEALELASTGKVDRLRGKILASVIEFKNQPAKVVVHRGDANPEYRFVVPREVAWPVASRPDLAASAFRLNQDLMDRLTRPGNEAERAQILLSSFFPAESRQKVEAHAALATAAREAIGALPRDLPGFEASPDLERDAEQLVSLFGGVALSKSSEPAVPLGEAAYIACLPLPLETLEQLARLDESLDAAVKRLATLEIGPSSAADELSVVDHALERLITSFSEPLHLALQGLAKIGPWHVAAGLSLQGDLGELLNSWLEQRALADIGRKAVEVAGFTAELNDLGLLDEIAVFSSLLEPSLESVGVLAKATAGWQAREMELSRQVLAAFGSQSATGEPSAQGQGSRFPSSQEFDALNSIGAVLGLPALGKQINQAMSDGKAAKLLSSDGRLEVDIGGHPDWAKFLLEELEKYREPCEVVRKFDPRSKSWRGSERLLLLGKAIKASRDLLKGSATIRTTLDQFIFSNPLLVAALNEMMALFTPARWAYQDIEFGLELTTAAIKDSKLAFNNSDGLPMDVRLNTAELNILTVALFLLCAPTRPNPLGLLILDDPLQNMDELTVTTLARGLGRLLELESWPKDWQILLLLHGEDDLERLRQEMRAAVYRLQWQSPLEVHDQPVTTNCEELESTYSAKLQRLEQVITPER